MAESAGERRRHPMVEESGRTVEEAVARALEALGLDRSAVEVEVLDEGSRGVLGLGARDAKVRVTPRAARGETAAQGETVKALAEELLGLMGFEAAVTVQEEPESVHLEVQGENLGALIGKHGQTLGAIEAVVGLLGGRRLGAPVRVEVDVSGYRERRRLALEGLATRTAERVARSGREIALSPMDSRDRRIIHLALQEHPKVTTVSRGEGEMRRVVVLPRNSVQEQQDRGDIDPGPRAQARQRAGGRSREPRTRPAGGPPSGVPRENGGAVPRGSEPRQPRFNERQHPGSRGAGRGTRPARRPWAPGTHPAPTGRPEGLPIDEELEAEIEAHLEKFRRPVQDPGEQGGGSPEEE